MLLLYSIPNPIATQKEITLDLLPTHCNRRGLFPFKGGFHLWLIHFMGDAERHFLLQVIGAEHHDTFHIVLAAQLQKIHQLFATGNAVGVEEVTSEKHSLI